MIGGARPARNTIDPHFPGMQKPKSWKCWCGTEVPDLPMPVLKHQLSHVKPRPFTHDHCKPDQAVPAPRARDMELS